MDPECSILRSNILVLHQFKCWNIVGIWVYTKISITKHKSSFFIWTRSDWSCGQISIICRRIAFFHKNLEASKINKLNKLLDKTLTVLVFWFFSESRAYLPSRLKLAKAITLIFYNNSLLCSLARLVIHFFATMDKLKC